VNRTRPLSAVFSKDHPEHLITRGPYRFIRNPFYSSYLSASLGGTIASAQPWLLLSVLIMAVIYYVAAIKEERKFEASFLAAEYMEYKVRTGMFIPHLRLSRLHHRNGQ